MPSQIPEKSAIDILEEAYKKFPNSNAIEFFGTKITYFQLRSKVLQLSHSLKELGVKENTKVGLYLPNSPHYIISYFAILYAGGVVVNFSPLYSESELANQLKDSDTEILITLNLKVLYDKAVKFSKKLIVGSIADYLGFPQGFFFKLFKYKHLAKVAYDENIVSYPKLFTNNSLKELPIIDAKTKVAVLQYTGGTTGVPKGAMLSHFNIFANSYQSKSWCYTAKEGQEKVMVVLPLFHTFANTVAMNMSIMLGAEMVLIPKFELEGLIKSIHKHKPTLFPAVPTIYNAITHFAGIENYNLRSIRLCVSGGDTLPVAVKHRFEEITGCKVIEGYGLTECSPVVCCNPVEGENRAGTIGLPFMDTDIAVFSHEGEFKRLGVGEKGELCVKGPQVMLGYYKKPKETNNILVDGWLKTGDIGIMDSDGYAKIVDRLKQVIIAGGYKIYPRIVEEAIYQYPTILECAVVGVEDKYRGQSAKAFLVAKKGEAIDIEDLKKTLEKKLSKYEMPSQFEIKESLPKTLIGKINKRGLN